MTDPTSPPEAPYPQGQSTSPPAGPAPRLVERILPRTLTTYGVLLGVAMIAAAWIWVHLIRGHAAFSDWFPIERLPEGLLLGAFVGAAFTALAGVLIDRIPPLKQIETLLMQTMHMEAFRWFHAISFGLIAGFPEEILFRGAIQPEIGLLATAILFGALHAITPAYFIYATVAGLMLGALTDVQGTLWASITAHAVIDTLMFMMLIRRYRQTWPNVAQPIS